MDQSNNMVHELLVGQVLNTIVDKTPNFTYMYAGFMCSMPFRNDFKNELCKNNTSADINVCIVMELVKDAKDLHQLFTQSTLPEGILAQLLLQIMCSLAIAYDACQFVHGDLHSYNILVYQLKTPITLTYTLANGFVVRLTNCSYIAKIIDYGRSKLKADGVAFSPILYDQDDKDQFTKPQMFENVLFLPNNYYPTFYDIVHLVGFSVKRLGTNGYTIPRPLNTLHSSFFMKIEEGSGKPTYMLANAHKLYQSILCKRPTDKKCGYTDYADYLKELHRTFSTLKFINLSTNTRDDDVKSLDQMVKLVSAIYAKEYPAYVNVS